MSTPPPSTQRVLEQRVLKETPAPEERGDSPAPLAEMASLGSLAPQDPQALQDLQASAETSLLKCLMDTMRNRVVWRCPAPWALLDPVVSLAPLVLLALKVSKVPLVNPASPVPLDPWDPVAPLAPLARTAMMVKLVNLAVPASAAPLAPRAHVVSPELLVCQA